MAYQYYSFKSNVATAHPTAAELRGIIIKVKEVPVTNAANLAFFMVNVSQALIHNVQKDDPLFGIQDLKAYFRGSKYVNETLKLLPQKPDQILIQQIFSQITKI